MDEICVGCAHRKTTALCKAACELDCKGAKMEVVDEFSIVTECRNYRSAGREAYSEPPAERSEKPRNTLYVALTGRDYFYVNTTEKTAEAALAAFK